MQLEELRGWLEDQLSTKSIPDKVWTILIEEGMAREGLHEHYNVEDLEDLVKDTERLLAAWKDGASSSLGAWRPGRRKRESEISEWLDDLENERRRVFGEHVARMAAEHPDVQTFRVEVLGERFPLSYEEALEEFVNEDGFIYRECPHAEQLNELTKELKRVYFWKEINASWFVLTGYIPPVNTFNVKTSSTWWRPYGPQFETITLTVEPWLSAEKVKRIYSDTQRQILGKDNGRVGEQSLKLLEFVAEQRETSGGSWRELMKNWNETYPEWAYTAKDPEHAKGNFYNAHKRAYERVVAPRYEHAGGFVKWSLSREERQERIERAVKGPGKKITPAEQREEKHRQHFEAFSRKLVSRRQSNIDS